MGERALRVWPEMNHAGSECCEAAGEQAEVGEKDPGGGAGDGRFEVFGQAPAAAEPGEGALDHPSSRQELEAFDPRRTLDDFDRPGAAIGDCLSQLRAAINAIGENMSQVRE